MLRIKCDYEGCEEERQIMNREFPKNWLYVCDFEYCPKCKDKAQKELNEVCEEEWECSECGFIWESNIEPEQNKDGEYCCEDCI